LNYCYLFANGEVCYINLNIGHANLLIESAP